VPPNQEEVFPFPVARPQRRACHYIRKLVRCLNRREQKAVNLLFYRGLSHPEVEEVMGLNERQLDSVLDSAFAKLREGIHPLLA
jgi:DNA-directed RNA polymerase specialized sigma24 family protein